MYCATPALFNWLKKKEVLIETNKKKKKRGKKHIIWGGGCLLARITIVALDLARILVEFAVLVRTNWMKAQVVV